MKQITFGDVFVVTNGSKTHFMKVDMGQVLPAERPMKSGTASTLEDADAIIYRLTRMLTKQIGEWKAENALAEEALATHAGAYYEQECRSWLKADYALYQMACRIDNNTAMIKRNEAALAEGFAIVRVTTAAVDV